MTPAAVALITALLSAEDGSTVQNVQTAQPANQPDKRPVADAASEGERDLVKAGPVLKKFVAGQPYGKKWLELAKIEPPPKDKTGLGAASTHGSLKNDPMELQQQAQYLESTATEVRYGFALIRGVRVFRYGKLHGVRLVVEQIGQSPREKFVQDVEAIASAWTDPVAALEVGTDFRVSKNDFLEQKKKKPAEYPVAPLVIELVPKEPRAK